MPNLPSRSALLAVFVAYGVASIAQGIVSAPSGWSTSSRDGLTVLSPIGAPDLTVTLSRLSADTDLQAWLTNAEPKLVICQLSTNTDAAGNPVTTLLAQDPESGATTVVLATQVNHDLLVSSLHAPNVPSAAHRMQTFSKMAGAWNGLDTSTSRSAGGGATATAGSSGGGNKSASSSSYTSPDGHYSTSSGSASASATSQNSQSSSQSNRDFKSSSQSNHSSQTNSDSMRDHKSSTDHNQNSGSNSNSNSQSNKNKSFQSSSQSSHQIVYDPAAHAFRLLPGSIKSGELSGDYRYSSDLLTAPIGSGFQPEAMGSNVHFTGGSLLLGDPAGHFATGKFQLDGNSLGIAYDSGGRETQQIRILESVDGIVTKFAVGPCLYVRTEKPE